MRLIQEIIYKYLVLACIVFGVYYIFLNFASFGLNTADGSIYLSTAENIANHTGFVVSYNLCQFFNGLYHPIWPYYQFLYSLFCALFINHGGIVQIIRINILLFALNSMLVFYIIQKLIPTRLNILFILFLVVSSNFFISALYPWTEQLYFFCFIVTFILFLKLKDHPGHLFWLGILNGVLMLLRVAHLYNFMAYLPILFIQKVSLKIKLKRALIFVGGFVLSYGLYQLFCLMTYHVLYPEYAKPGASYGMARFESGSVYQLGHVGLQIPLKPFFTVEHLKYIGQHLWDFCHQMPFFVLPALFYYFLPLKKRVEGGLIELCIFQSVFTVLGYSLTFYWLTYSFDSLRYSMVPFVLMSVVGWYCLYQGLSLSESTSKKLMGGIVLLVLISPQLDKFMAFQERLFKSPPFTKPYYRAMFESYAWIDKNLPVKVLVASNEDQQGYFMHRPYISTPVGESFTCGNIILFNRIYAPDYYLLSAAVGDKCFATIKHEKVFSNKIFRLFKVGK